MLKKMMSATRNVYSRNDAMIIGYLEK